MKPNTLILLVVAILSSVASTFFYFQSDTAKEQLQQEVALAAKQAAEFQTKLTGASAQSESLQKKLAELDSALGEAKSKASTADVRSTQLGREMSQLNTQLSAKTNAAQALTNEVGQLKQELAQLKLTAATIAAEQSEVSKATINKLQARIADLSTTNKTHSDKSDLTANADEASAPTAPNPPLVADTDGFKVVNIGEKNAFVLIKADPAQRIIPQQNLFISRGGKVVAEAVVSKRQENYAIAQIVNGSIKGKIKKGDLATFAQ